MNTGQCTLTVFSAVKSGEQWGKVLRCCCLFSFCVDVCFPDLATLTYSRCSRYFTQLKIFRGEGGGEVCVWGGGGGI